MSASRATPPRLVALRRAPLSDGLLAELRQDLRDLLLAVHHLGQKADAVDLAFVVPARLDQDVGLVVGRDRQPVHGSGEALAVELPDLLLGRILAPVTPPVPLSSLSVPLAVDA